LEPYSIRKSVYIKAPAEQVFAALASREAMAEWFSEDPAMVFEAKVGGQLGFRSYGVDISGKVLEFLPPRKLAFTWNQTPPGYEQPTQVTIELVDERDGTRVHLVHSGFNRLPAVIRHDHFEGYKQGWESDELFAVLHRLVENKTLEEPLITSQAICGEDGPERLEVRNSIYLEAPVERVWQAFSSEEALRQWWHPTTQIDLRPGGKYSFHGVHHQFTFHFFGEVLEFVPNEKLVLTWNDYEQPWPTPALLTIHVSPEKNGTRVTILHHGFEKMNREMAEQLFYSFRLGWDG
ncbi:SRPBCC domain-containing protein, partial [Microbacteriaceae bacterium K1510]|nr:SRPBCC domain-containing protein [Microbacteriaceae bacterium K1510]